MYHRILVAVENSPADQAILDHVRQLATQFGSELHLVHVADGWVARNFDQLKLRESEEMKDDRDYLQRVAADLAARGLKVSTELALGDPADGADPPRAGTQCRSARDVDARPSLPERSPARHHGQPRPPFREDSYSARPGSIIVRIVPSVHVLNRLSRSMALRGAISTPSGKKHYVRRLFATIADRYDLITVFFRTVSIAAGRID